MTDYSIKLPTGNEVHKPILDEYFTEDENFKSLMGLFLKSMSRADKSGGLYIDGVVSK